MFDSIFAKATALCSMVTIATPTEILKMRMQSNIELHNLGRISQPYKSIPHCARTILKNEGLSGFWKGNIVMMARIFPIQAINYYMRKFLQKHFKSTYLNNIGIGIAAGITAAVAVYPSDILRQFMNNQVAGHMTVRKAIKTIIKDYGYKYFYKGLHNLLVTLTIYRGIANGSYDTHKTKVRSIKEKAVLSYFITVFAQYVVYPVQIVRRRRIVINAKQGYFAYVKKIWREQGWKGFYRGGTIVPLQSIMWSMALLIFDTAGLSFETAVDV